jgi:hypothetical protein
MISVCVRLRHIYSHIQICTRNEALKLFEDMFSVDFLRTEQESGPRVIISYSAVIHRRFSLQTGIIRSSFLQIFWIFQWYQSVPVPSSSVTGPPKDQKQLQCSCFFNSRLSFRRWSYSKACILMKKGNIAQVSEYSSGTS